MTCEDLIRLSALARRFTNEHHHRLTEILFKLLDYLSKRMLPELDLFLYEHNFLMKDLPQHKD